MKITSFHFKNLFFALLAFNTLIFSQNEEDSLVTELDSILQVSIIEQEYVSSASKYFQTPEEAPSSITVISSNEINSFGYSSLTELLNAQKGFYYSNDRSGDYLGVRGFGRSSDHNNRILLLFDGHRLNPYQIDYAPIGQVTGFDLSNFERVEIVRGPGSTLYGNNAIHGVINLVPQKNEDSYLPKVNVKYGSYNSKYLGLRTSQHISDEFSFAILGNYYESEGEDLFFKEFNSPDKNNGIAEKKDGMRYNSLYANLKYNEFSLSAIARNTNKVLPTAPYSTKFNEYQNQYNKSENLYFSWSPNLSYDKSLIINLGYDHQIYGSRLPFEFLTQKIEFIGSSSTVSGDVQFIWDILPQNRLISGIEYKDNYNSKYKYFSGDFVFVNDIWSYKIFSAFFQNEYQYSSNLSLYFGLRLDNFVGQENELNPRAGIVYSPFTNHTFKFLYGRSFRAPNLVERNLEEKNIAGFKKNIELKSEFINTWEFIWNYNILQNLKSNVSLFSYRMGNLIDQVEDPLDNLLQYVNIEEVNANGVEVEFQYNKDDFKSYLSYSYQIAKNKKDEKLTNSPEHLLKFGVVTKIYNILNGAFQINYESKRKTVYNEYTDPLLLANLNLFSDKLFGSFKISLKINNLFNHTIKHPGGYELVQKTIIQPYRNYLFSVEFGL